MSGCSQLGHHWLHEGTVYRCWYCLAEHPMFPQLQTPTKPKPVKDEP